MMETSRAGQRQRNTRRVAFGLALVFLLLLCVGPQVAGAAEIPFVDGVPVPSNVRPVFIVQGSDYDMGYQFFHQQVDVFGADDWWLTPFQSLDYEVGDVWSPGMTFSDEHIKSLKARQWKVMQAMPWAIEFMKGAAAGATDAGLPLSYADVLAYFCRTLETHPGLEPEGSQDEDLPPHECSGFAAWGRATKDGSLIVGANGDHELQANEFTVMFYPDDGNSFVLSSIPGSIWHPGMNNKGLAYVHHAGNNVGNGNPDGYGLPRDLAMWNILRYANNADEAKDMMLATDFSGDPRNKRGIWVDVDGRNWAIEAKDPLAVRQAGYMGEKDFIYAGNHTLHRVLEGFQEPDPEMGLYYIPHAGYLGATFDYWDPDSVARCLSMWNMLRNYRGKVDVEFAKMMYRFRGPKPKATMDELAESYDTSLGKGLNTPIGSVENAYEVVCRPDAGDEGVYYVAQGHVARGGHPHWPGGWAYPPGQLFSFYKLTLAESPQRVVGESSWAAQCAMYYADQELRKLTGKNPTYAALLEDFDVAAKAWYVARWERNLSRRAEGNEAMAHLNKALRSFAKCEAYANHVYEALVPPATTPSDLGLKKWGGSWGKWATRGYPWDSNNKRDRVAEVIVPPK